MHTRYDRHRGSVRGRRETGRRPAKWRHPIKARRHERRLWLDAVERAQREKRAGDYVAGVLEEPTKGRFRKWRYRHRRVLAVLPVGLGLVAFRVALPPAMTYPFMVALALVLIGGAWWVMSCSGPDETQEGVKRALDEGGSHRGLAAATALAGIAWWTIPLDGVLAGLILVTALLIAAIVRARHFRIRPAPPPPDTWREDAWLARVAGGRAPALPGTGLARVEDCCSPEGAVIGWQAVIVGEQGIHTWAKYRAARTAIASAYGVSEDQVLLDRLPNRAEDSAVLKVVDADEGNPLLQVEELTETTFDPVTGCYDHAISADRTPGPVKVYDQELGAYPTWFSGYQGTGKSGGVDTGLTEVTSAGVVHTVLIDCKGGASVADWEDASGTYLAVDPDNPEDVRQAEAVLLGVRAMIAPLSADLQAIKIHDAVTGEYLGKAKCLPVNHEYPATLLVLEEAPQLFRRSPLAARLVREILELGRAFQIIVWLVSQETTEKDAFANDGTIRKLMRAGNIIVYRNATEAGKMTLQGALEVDPSAIPALPGTGYVLSPVDRRNILRRTRWTRYPAKRAAVAVIPPMRASAAFAFERARDLHLNPPVEVPEQRPPGEPASMPEREKLRLELRDLVWEASGPFKTGDAVRHFESRGVSPDAVQRMFTKLHERGDISDAGHGLWSRPLQEAAK